MYAKSMEEDASEEGQNEVGAEAFVRIAGGAP